MGHIEVEKVQPTFICRSPIKILKETLNDDLVLNLEATPLPL